MSLPAVADWRLPEGWQAIEFISDLHLSPATPRTFAAFRHHLATTTADAVCLLGDVVEAWVGDDATHEPDSFEAQCATVLREAAQARCIAFMAGNRDFLVGDALLARLGVRRLDDPTRLSGFGRRVLVTHGDLLCTADTAYQALRRQVRDPAWQQAVLARPIAERRALARQMREASRDAQNQRLAETWSDIDADLAAAWLREAGSAQLVNGHTHRPGRYPLAGGGERWELSDWDFDGDGPPRGDMLRWTAAGFERRPVTSPPGP